MRTARMLIMLVAAGSALSSSAVAGTAGIARLKYGGGGDWYNDPDAEANLAREFAARTGWVVDTQRVHVAAGDDDLFAHPFLFLTGHGEISFTRREAERLGLFLSSGGFVYADDDYGMDRSFRREFARVLPGSQLVELPPDHPLFSCYYDLRAGVPKIHRHDDGRPRALGIFIGNRLAVLYTYESNISDGWTPAYNDPPEKREEAFRMGVNIMWYVLTNE